MASRPARHTVTGPSTGPAAHAARPGVSRARVLGLTAAGGALLALIGVGLWALTAGVEPTGSTPTSAQQITVTAPRHP